MKLVLKTIETNRDLDYGETFNSKKNLRIRRSLVPELQKALAPNFRPSASQLTNWLNCLHKSRRTRYNIRNNGRIAEENRRTHNNSRVQDVSISDMNYGLFM